MSNTEHPVNEAGEREPQTGERQPDSPALKENREADFGEKGVDVPDKQAGLDEAEKLDDAVADLDNE